MEPGFSSHEESNAVYLDGLRVGKDDRHLEIALETGRSRVAVEARPAYDLAPVNVG